MTAPIAGFDVQVCVPLSSTMAERVETEGLAVALAESWVGPKSAQVTVTCHTTDPAGSFAIRHFVWEDGKVRDTGWSHWVDRKFVGGNDGPLQFQAVPA